jgi:hypothetical protein
MSQLTFGLMSGVEKVAPYAVGDVLVKHNSERYVVTLVDSNDNGGVFVCVNLKSGAEAVILEREIAYRSR